MKKDISTYLRTTEILAKYDIRAKKGFGQNFLIDNNIIRNIVNAGDIDDDTGVIEIGPGIGALTEYLCRKAKKVVCFEIDERLKIVLEDTLSDYHNIEIIFEDFLKTDINKIINDKFANCKNICVVANLPYYITTPIIIKILESRSRIKKITVMVQQEVAQRISGRTNTKEYNSLTVFLNYFCDAKIAFNVPKNVFIPKPNVGSSVVVIDIKDKQFNVTNEELLFNIIRNAFKQRRKTLVNNLGEYFNNKEYVKLILEKLNYNLNIRAEALKIEDFIKIANYISENEQ